MKQYNIQLSTTNTLIYCLVAVSLVTLSCRKEKVPEPSGSDPNYFVIIDNPNDLVDHNIYEFYKSTGIACFYNDSIYKKRVSREDESPARYSYIKLSLKYTPTGSSNVTYKSLSSRDNISPLLTLMQEEMVPRLPSGYTIPSIYLIDSFSIGSPIVNIQIPHGWTALHGFNTVGIVVKDVVAMNSDERKMYVASILAGIAKKRIADLYASQFQKEFLNISRAATKDLLPVDIYIGLPWMFLVPLNKMPLPEDCGFLYYPTNLFGVLPLASTPREEDDIRAFLTAAFFYSEQVFENLHPDHELLLKKMSVIRNYIKKAGFKLSE